MFMLLVQPQLPLVNAISSLLPPASPAAAQPSSPHSLPPGTSSLIHPWNETLYPACPGGRTDQSLQSVSGSASITATIAPPQLGNATSGQAETQTYRIFANGSLLVTDDNGNRLALGPLVIRPKVNFTVSLAANSTYAVQTYVVTRQGAVVGEVNVTYRLVTVYCRTSGLEITVSGKVSVPGNGLKIAIPLIGLPSSTGNGSVWFRKADSDPGIGFDWSDSAAFHPSYLSSNETLVYRVGGTFAIDPHIIGYSSDTIVTAPSSSRKLFYFDGDYLAFYSTGYAIVCQSSPDGIKWSAPTVITESQGSDHTANLGMWVEGDQVMYALSTDGYDYWFFFRSGTLTGGCSIDWSTAEQRVGTTYPTIWLSTSVTVASDGTVYVSVADDAGYTEVYRDNSSISGFVKAGTIDGGETLVPLTQGKVAMVGFEPGPDYLQIWTTSNHGETWSGPVTGVNAYTPLGLGAAAVGDTVYVGAVQPTTPCETYAVTYQYGASSMTEQRLGQTSGSTDWCGSASVSTDGYAVAIVYGAGTDVFEAVGFNGSSSWESNLITDGEMANYGGVSYITSSYQIYNGTVASMWSIPEDNGSQYQDVLRFAALPVYFDPAIAGQDSWSRPGLSPYESYFEGLDEYVSPGNGLLGVSLANLELPGRGGLDLDIGLVYSEPYAFSGGAPDTTPFQYDAYPATNLGQGWTLNFPWMGTDYLHLTDGQAYPYQWSANGTVFEHHGATDFRLVRTSNAYELYVNSGIIYTFSLTNESLMTIANPSGSDLIRFSYGSNGYISQITDDVGRVVTFAYNSDDQLSSISSGGRKWQYSYASWGSVLTSVTDPMGRVTQFSYQTNLNVLDWLLTQVTYPTGGSTVYTYTSQSLGTELVMYPVVLQDVYTYYSGTSSNLVSSTSISYTLTGMGQTVWSNFTSADGNGIYQGYTRNYYDTQKAYSREFDYDQTDTLIKATETDFDALGRVNETKVLSATGAVLATTKNLYDNWGNLIQTTDPDGETMYYSYLNTNSQDRFSGGSFSDSFYHNNIPWNVRDSLAGAADYQNLTSVPQETYFQYTPSGYLNQTKVLDNGGWLTTKYAYDVYGNQISATDPEGNTTYYDYSSAYSHTYLTQESIVVGGKNLSESFGYQFSTGFQTSATDWKGNTTSYSYDALGRVTQVTYPAVGGVVYTESYSYNDAQNTVKITDEDYHVSLQSYDGLGRLTSVAYYNGSSVYSTESYTYNWQGQVATDTTPAGHTYYYSYDYLGNLVKSTDPSGNFTTASYDYFTNTVTQTDQNGHQTTYLYDYDGRLTTVWEYYTPTSYYVTSYTRDGVGDLLRLTDGKNNVTTYYYDDLSQIVKTVYADHSSQTQTYDKDGNVLTATDQRGYTTRYAYDAMDRLTTATFPNSTKDTFAYDSDGDLLKMTYPAQPSPGATDSTTYTYDALGRMTSQTETIGGKSYTMGYTYDGDGNVVSMTYPDKTSMTMSYDFLDRLTTLGNLATITYTLDNQVSTVKYADGQTQTYSYNSRDEPSQILVMDGAVKQLDLNYSYDKAGNVVKIGSETYGYDYLNRLTSASGPWGQITYTYDAVGNRLRETQGTTMTSYSYNDVYEMTKAGSNTYSYDKDGNLVQEISGGTTWKYGYDYDGDLINVTKTTGSTSTLVEKNVYDAAGARVEEVAGSTTTVFMYAGGNVVYYKAGSSVTKLYYADGMQIARVTGSTTYYYAEDELGSVRLVMTSAGKITFQTDYRPYGQLQTPTGSDPFEYTDKLLDSATGLYYSGARFYDPTTGRFITKDPGGGGLTDPQSLNAYTYAEDNPLTNVDPTGLVSWRTIGLFALAGVLLVTAAAQGGLDALNDAAEAAVFSEAIDSLSAAAVGAAVVEAAGPLTEGQLNAGINAATADFADFLLTNAETGEQTLLENVAVPRNPSAQALGEFGENLLNRLVRNALYQPSIWNGGDLYEGALFKGDFAWADIAFDSKVGLSFDLEQFDDYLASARFGESGGTYPIGVVIRAIHYVFFENPFTGGLVAPGTLIKLAANGVYRTIYFVNQV